MRTASATARIAVYRPVRTVVWQGSVGDRRPYADLTGKAEVIPGQKSASGTCAENTSNARGSRWSDLLSLSEPQFSIACGDRPPHSLPRSFTRLIFSPLPLRRQSPFGVGLMSLLGSPVRSESDLALFDRKHPFNTHSLFSLRLPFVLRAKSNPLNPWFWHRGSFQLLNC